MAKVNYLLKNPLNINVVGISGLGTDKIDMRHIHNFVAVGDVPADVRDAIKNPKAKGVVDTLKDYYGKKWRDKLGETKLGPNKLFISKKDFNLDNFIVKLRTDEQVNEGHLNEDSGATGGGLQEDTDWDSGQYIAGPRYIGQGSEDVGNIEEIDQAFLDHIEYTNKKLFTDGAVMDFNAVSLDSSSLEDINISDADLADLDLEDREVVPLSEMSKKISVVENFDLSTNFKVGEKTPVFDICIYPEDKISELKEKIQLISGIPSYRQYLFWYDNDFLNNTYNLISDNLYEINIFKHFKKIGNEQVIFNTSIDKSLYNNRKNIKVESLDYFTTVDYINIDNSQVYVIDLADFIEPYRLEMREFLSDNYQFELYYYGFIIKFWPMMTPEIFYDYIDSERVLYQKYPMLAFTNQNIRFKYNQQIAIANYNYKNAVKIDKIIEGEHPSIKVDLAITDVILSTAYGSKQLINLRILFDKLRTNYYVPEIVAHIRKDNKKYLLRKAFILNKQRVPFPAAFKTGLIIAIKMSRNINYKEYIFVNVMENGKYYIKLNLNEEDGYDFDRVLLLAKKHTDKIIEDINKFSREISNSKQAVVPLTKATVYYFSINVSVIWKKLIKPRAYKFIRVALEAYINANILTVKNYTQIRGHEIMFRKGIVEFDSTLIEKVLAAAKLESIKNYYMFLSNGTLYQKWMQLYDGRTVFMQHRTTDVKFEIHNVKEREFTNFYMYITGLILQLTSSSEFKKIEQERFIESDKKNKKLKKLQEVDPVLYRLKKYNTNKLYSIACQNPHQPFIYTKAELDQMSDRQKSKLTKYWNFTLNKPAYYGCPNSAYPHLSFIIGIHPKFYCLPCCGKRLTNVEGSKKNLINNICLTRHEFLPEDLEKNKKFLRGLQFKMRHVMNYGKNINLGRSVRLPQNDTLQDLFYGTLDESGINYFIQGTNQHSQYMQNIGYIYALAYILDADIKELINTFIRALKHDPKLFNMIENGKLLKYFNTMSSFISALENIFINEIDDIYIQKYNDSDLWNKIFIELTALVLNTYTFMLYDEKTTGKYINLYITNSVYNGILQNSQPNRNITYIIVFKQVNRYYPVIVATDPVKILSKSETLYKTFDYKSPVIKNFYSMVNMYIQKNRKINQPIDLNFMKLMLEDSKEYTIKTKLINMRNLCYALLIECSNGPSIYLPVHYSMNVADGISIDFEAFDPSKHKLPFRALADLTAKINDRIKEVNKLDEKSNKYINNYKLIVFYQHQTFEGKCVGLVDNNEFLYYTHDYDEGYIKQDQQVFHYALNYYPPEINKLIVGLQEPEKDDRTVLLGESLYKNYLYQLFLVEFNNYVEKEKNTKVRNKIMQVLDIKHISQSLSDLQNTITTLLGSKYKEDANTINTQIANLYYKGQKGKADIIEIIDNTIYNFDLQVIKQMHGMKKKDIIAKLEKIVPKFCVEGKLPAKMTMENIYVPCEYKAQDFCQAKKLIVEKGKMAMLIDLLADDIRNPIKMKYLTSGIFTDKIINYFNFERNPDEIITIKSI